MELRRGPFIAEFLDPRRAFEATRVPAEVRWDPLTGQTCRLLPEGSLPPPSVQDLDALAEQSRLNCPFCTGQIESKTPRFPPEVCPEGRIQFGEAVLFPNLFPYAKWSSVSVYSPERHLLRLEELTPPLIRDNLAAQAFFARAMVAHDPESRWMSINANQLPPSGSSIFHPHLQGSVHPVPTTAQRLFADLSPGRLAKYLELERREGERLIASTGRVDWVAAFAPVGPAEIRAFVSDTASPDQFDDQSVAEVADGISLVLRLYHSLGFQSFNLALFGAADGFVLARLVARAYYGPLQRGDAMWSERLHWEAAIDLPPESVAERGREFFSGRS